MTLHFLIFILFCLHFSFVQPHEGFGQPLILLAKSEEQTSLKEELGKGSLPGIEEFEKEKQARMKRNVGRRLMFVKTNNPAVFYESPDDLERKLRIKREKEGFVIVEVVQNQSGTMNFYQVKFDSGEIGYLSADAYHLEIKIKEGSLLSIPKRANTKKRSSSQPKIFASEAIQLVKSHMILLDSATGEKRSVEMKMIDQRARAFPNLRWRYEAKEIATHKYRVTQHAGEGSGPSLIRTWIVDVSTNEVAPENLAAKEMYR
ncbi:MAG: hypothetical protein HXY44_01880 [Syntrophaceae bacterium]|nr:hypothetical protein [Syntrophaceae bacterium]